ncbi:hypothetical protein BASA81_002677 [Batrachochytrium salamandrivorans]|nr:hypothetical protein BASA81_002677 [Batrachochytrium salamandrivorans]
MLRSVLVRAPALSRRAFSVATTTTEVPTMEVPSTEVPTKEEVAKFDAEAKLAAQAQIESEIESRKTPVSGVDFHRVPHLIMPWQKKWFPNDRFVLVSPKELDLECTELSFKVPPHLTKHEIVDTLRAVYGFDVQSVTTVIRLGKEKLPVFSRKTYRRPTYKLARVLLNSPYKVQQPSNQRKPVRAEYKDDENKE